VYVAQLEKSQQEAQKEVGAPRLLTAAPAFPALTFASSRQSRTRMSKQDRLHSNWEFKSSTGELTDEEKKGLMNEVYSTQLYTFLHNCVHFRMILSNGVWPCALAPIPSRRTQDMTSSSCAVSS
jgi:hypothetical protein